MSLERLRELTFVGLVWRIVGEIGHKVHPLEGAGCCLQMLEGTDMAGSFDQLEKRQ